MSKFKILYLCPKYPYPMEIGEDFGYNKDISDLAKSKYVSDVMLFLLNKENKRGEFPYGNLSYEVFETTAEKKLSLFTKIKAFFEILFCKFPHGMAKFITSDMKNKINSAGAEIVILDSIYGMAMLPKGRYKLIYIAHNFETELARDNAKIQPDIFRKIYFGLMAKKIEKLEKELITKADVLVCVSTSDYKQLSKLYPEKTEFLAHKADTGDFSWQPKTDKTLLFCGPISHHPNMEAIEWIVNNLSPVLDKNIRIKIVGKGTDELPAELHRDNIDFLGFVSAEELKSLYQTCSAFICPIVYGSGVKIKVTEALSYGMPVIATKESLEGLDYVEVEPLIDRNDMQKTKNNIESLLNDNTKLQKYSEELISKVKEYQQQTDNSLEKIIDKINKKGDNYDIISLGYDCAVRRYLTMGGLKKTKAQGELSMVFDLSYCPTKSLIKILRNDFIDYFKNLEFKNNVWRNRKYKILYNHDKDCGINDKEKLVSRFTNRIENFRKIISTSPYCYFVLKSISSAKEVNDLYKILKFQRKNLPFKLIVLDMEQKLIKYDSFNEDIVICSVKSPFPQTDDWWKPEYINSEESINFQEEICNFIEGIINLDFNVSKWNKEDVNQENGEY